ncbi:MAG: response regulator [Deltaproteobacteria bacterium]|nr:response regulator [Deltaproteobacteria bacterium]
MSTLFELPDAQREALRGIEVLLVDRDERVRDGFRKLLASAGVLVTATEDDARALEWAREKYFSVAVVDVDTPAHDAGLGLLRELRAASPATAVVLLSARQTFDIAADGFRAGAADVVAKSPENVSYLTEQVVKLCLRSAKTETRDRLLSEVLDVHEQFLKRLIDATRRAAMAEEAAGGGSQVTADVRECVVLVVDDNPRNGPSMQAALGTTTGYRVFTALTGGEALDFVGQHRFQIALVKEGLPDLPSSMVIKSLKGEVPDGIVLVYLPPGETPGRVEIVQENSQHLVLIPEFTDGDQLVGQMQELREAYVAKVRERRYLQFFRREHYDFLRRYVELRQKITALLPPGKTAPAE